MQYYRHQHGKLVSISTLIAQERRGDFCPKSGGLLYLLVLSSIPIIIKISSQLIKTITCHNLQVAQTTGVASHFPHASSAQYEQSRVDLSELVLIAPTVLGAQELGRLATDTSNIILPNKKAYPKDQLLLTKPLQTTLPKGNFSKTARSRTTSVSCKCKSQTRQNCLTLRRGIGITKKKPTQEQQHGG